MNIKGEFFVLCETCPELDAIVAQEEIYADREIFTRNLIVRCKHRELCEAIQNHIKIQSETEGKKNGSN